MKQNQENMLGNLTRDLEKNTDLSMEESRQISEKTLRKATEDVPNSTGRGFREQETDLSQF